MTDASHSTTADPDAPIDDEAVIASAEAQIAEALAGERRLTADNAIKGHVLAAMGLGLVPCALFDVAALSGAQLAMIRRLSQIHEVPFEANRAQSVVISLIAGSAPVAGVVALSSGVKLLPGIGTLLGSGSLAVTGGAVTYAIGRTIDAHFAAGNDLLCPDMGKLRERFRRELGPGRRFAASLGAEANRGKSWWRRRKGAAAASTAAG